MGKFYINYNTGAGNYWFEGTLDEAMKDAAKDLCYTQQGVRIEENGEPVAYLPWREGRPDEDDFVTCQFGDRGFYGEWIIGDGNLAWL